MEISDTSGYVSDIASNMQRLYPYEKVLSGPYLFHKYDPNNIAHTMGMLGNDNYCASLIAKNQNFYNIKQEPWYGTEFSSEKLERMYPDTDCSLSVPDIALPSANLFIPTNFDLHGVKAPMNNMNRTTAPVMIRNDEHGRIFQKLDDVFAVPKLHSSVFIKFPAAYSSPKNATLTRF